MNLRQPGLYSKYQASATQQDPDLNKQKWLEIKFNGKNFCLAYLRFQLSSRICNTKYQQQKQKTNIIFQLCIPNTALQNSLFKIGTAFKRFWIYTLKHCSIKLLIGTSSQHRNVTTFLVPYPLSQGGHLYTKLQTTKHETNVEKSTPDFMR